MYTVQYRMWYGEGAFLWWTFGRCKTLREAESTAERLRKFYASTDVRILSQDGEVINGGSQ